MALFERDKLPLVANVEQVRISQDEDNPFSEVISELCYWRDY